MTSIVPPPPQRPKPPRPASPQWTQPGEHLRTADQWIAKADEMAFTGGVNAETIPRLTVLIALADAHTRLAMAKRPAGPLHSP